MRIMDVFRCLGATLVASGALAMAPTAGADELPVPDGDRTGADCGAHAYQLVLTDGGLVLGDNERIGARAEVLVPEDVDHGANVRLRARARGTHVRLCHGTWRTVAFSGAGEGRAEPVVGPPHRFGLGVRAGGTVVELHGPA